MLFSDCLRRQFFYVCALVALHPDVSIPLVAACLAGSAVPGLGGRSCVVDGIVVPELNETIGDGDDNAVPRPGEVFVDSVSSAKDR